MGKDPPAEVRALGQQPGLTVTGTVPDLRPYLQRATVALAPVAYGVGIQNKVLEAMACGTPVVASPQAVSALEAVDGRDVVVARRPGRDGRGRRTIDRGRSRGAWRSDWRDAGTWSRTTTGRRSPAAWRRSTMKSSASGFEALSESLPKMRPLIARSDLAARLAVADAHRQPGRAGWLAGRRCLARGLLDTLRARPAVLRAGRRSVPAALSVARGRVDPRGVLLVALLGGYHRRNLLGGVREYALLFKPPRSGLLASDPGRLPGDVPGHRPRLAGALHGVRPSSSPPGVALASDASSMACGACGCFLKSGNHRRRRTGRDALLAEQLLSWSTSACACSGSWTIASPKAPPCSASCACSRGWIGLDGLIQRHGVEELILATSALTRDQIVSTFERYGMADQVNLRLSSGLFEIITTGMQVREMASVPLVSVNKVRLTGLDRLEKWALDYAITDPHRSCSHLFWRLSPWSSSWIRPAQSCTGGG